MGYGIRVQYSDFSIETQNVEQARLALLDWGARAMGVGWRKDFDQAPLEDLFRDMEWDLGSLLLGGSASARCPWMRSFCEDGMFKAVGPWVKAGSYIEMRGQEGEVWRYLFDGQRCTKQRAEIKWVDEEVCDGTAG